MRRLVAEKVELGEDHSECISDQQLQPGVVEEDQPRLPHHPTRSKTSEEQLTTARGPAARSSGRFSVERLPERFRGLSTRSILRPSLQSRFEAFRHPHGRPMAPLPVHIGQSESRTRETSTGPEEAFPGSSIAVRPKASRTLWTYGEKYPPSDLSADMRVCQPIICKGIGSGSRGCVRRAGMAGQALVEQADDLNLWVWCLEGGRSLVVDIRCWHYP